MKDPRATSPARNEHNRFWISPSGLDDSHPQSRRELDESRCYALDSSWIKLALQEPAYPRPRLQLNDLDLSAQKFSDETNAEGDVCPGCARRLRCADG